MSRRGIDTRSTLHPGPGGSACTSPDRSTTTTVARWRVSSSRRHVPMFATASAPNTRNRSRSRAGNTSSVSAVTDGPSRSISIAEASTPSTPVDRGVDQRETIRAPMPPPDRASATDRRRRRGAPDRVRAAASTSVATTTCPTCTGSNVPPNTPRRSVVPVIGGSLRATVVFTLAKHSCHPRP